MELTDDIQPLAMARSMPSNNGSAGGNRQNGETPVANIPYRIYNPFPRTNQVLMHYRTSGNGTIASSNNTTAQISFRLNSITDIQTSYAYSADPDRSAIDTIDATINIPAMRNFWSCVYDYYTVVRSRYHFRVRPANTDKNNLDVLDIFQHLHGKQSPPLIGAGGIRIDYQYRKRFPQTIHKQIKMHPNGATSTAGVVSDIHYNDMFTDIYGEWYPGMINHEIEEDELKSTWTKFQQTPKIPEFVSYVFQRSAGTPTDREMAFYWEMLIDYEVQLKSLKDQFQYIRPSVTINMDPPDIPANVTTGPPALVTLAANQVYSQIN